MWSLGADIAVAGWCRQHRTAQALYEGEMQGPQLVADIVVDLQIN